MQQWAVAYKWKQLGVMRVSFRDMQQWSVEFYINENKQVLCMFPFEICSSLLAYVCNVVFYSNFSKEVRSPTNHTISPCWKTWFGSMDVRFCCPSSMPTTRSA